MLPIVFLCTLVFTKLVNVFDFEGVFSFEVHHYRPIYTFLKTRIGTTTPTTTTCFLVFLIKQKCFFLDRGMGTNLELASANQTFNLKMILLRIMHICECAVFPSTQQCFVIYSADILFEIKTKKSSGSST